MKNQKCSWKRKFSETCPGETDKFGSISSHSERYSDDMNAIDASPDNNTQSPDVISKALSDDVNDGIRSLTEKLSAAQVDVSVKEDLVKQHSEVAEEAIAGWEKAEKEVVVLKQKLEDAVRQNSTLEDRLSRFDGALKECVKQLRQAREEQEQKIIEAVENATREWETTKYELEKRLLELQGKSESVRKLDALEKENSALKLELSIYVEEMEIRTIERDLSTEAAEAASKQHIESVKKLAKLEAECRRLKVMGCKSCFVNAENSLPASTYVESFADGQSNSWRSGLITEFDPLKNGKVIGRYVSGSRIETDLMEDFLEMERLAALDETKSENKCLEPKADVEQSKDDNYLLKADLEAMIHRTAELEEKLEKLELEKAELENALVERQECLEASELQLRDTEAELAELRMEIRMANEVKQDLETRLSSMESDAKTMSVKIDSLVAEIEKERTLTEQVSVNADESKQLLESQLVSIKEEARMMSAKIDSFERLEVEKAELETALVKSQESLERLESQLSSMETDRRTMSAKIDSLVAELEKERSLSEQVSIEEEARMMSSKIDSLEKLEVEKAELETALAKSQESLEASELQLRDAETNLMELRTELCIANKAKQHLEAQLSSIEREARMMSAKIDSLEAEIEKERTLSKQVSANANESKQLLESQLISIEAEARMMSAKIESLEAEIEKERILSEQVSANANESKQLLESRLISIEAEARMMSAKIDMLETEVKRERALSSQISVKCRELEEELSRKQHKAKLQHTANSNVESKIKQEDLVVAAGKLVECQKTIASLGQQLESLATLKDFLIDTTSIPELTRDPKTPRVSARRYSHSVNKVGNTPPSSFSSSPIVSSNPGSSEKNRNGFAEFLIRSKNGIQLEI